MPPWILLSVLLSTAYGALFHLWRGGDARRLGLILFASWIGFGLGQVVGLVIDWNGLMLGEVHLIEASLGSLIALIVVNRPPA